MNFIALFIRNPIRVKNHRSYLGSKKLYQLNIILIFVQDILSTTNNNSSQKLFQKTQSSSVVQFNYSSVLMGPTYTTCIL